MAITTLDGAISGCEPPLYFLKTIPMVVTRSASTFNATGIPGAAVISTAGLGGEALTSYPGQIPFTNPSAGQKAYLARLAMGARVGVVTMILCDRVWHNSGFDVTTTAVQNFTGCPNFNRDVNNATGVGEGIFVGVEYYSALATTANFSITYTNSAGVTGRTASTGTLNTSMTTSAFAPFTLQTGDLGVRSIQSASISATVASGTVSFVAYRPITTISCMTSNATMAIDPLTGGLPEIYNNSVLFFIVNSSGSPVVPHGTITFTKG